MNVFLCSLNLTIMKQNVFSLSDRPRRYFGRKFLTVFCILFLTRMYCQTNETPSDSVIIYHDSLYYKIMKQLPQNTWNFNSYKEIKNQNLEKMFDPDFTNSFIKMHHILQEGNSFTQVLPQIMVTYAGNNMYCKQMFTVKKLGKATLNLMDKNIQGVNCYQVSVIRRYDMIPYLKEEISTIYFAADHTLNPLSWYTESYLKDEALNNYNYLRIFIIADPASNNSSQSDEYNALKDSVKLNCSPNPADNMVTISYHLPYSANIQLLIRDIGGNEKIIEVSNNKAEGEHSNTVDLSGYFPGVYNVQLKINSVIITTHLIHS